MDTQFLTIAMRFTAQLSELPGMMQFIQDLAKKAGFDESRIRKLELASEEAIVNIISYAYPKENPGPIDLECHYALGQFEIVFKDQGRAFNPLEAEIKVPKDIPPEKRPIGGLGIYLMRQLMDGLSYQRKEDQNILRMILKH